MLNEIIRLILRVAVIICSYRLITPYLFQEDEFKINKSKYLRLSDKKSKVNKISLVIIRHFDKLFMFEKNYVPYQSGKKFILTLILTFASSFLFLMMMLYRRGIEKVNNPFTATSIHQVVDISISFLIILSLAITVIPYLYQRQRWSKRSTQGTYDLKEVVKLFSQFGQYSIDQALRKTSDLLHETNQLKNLVRYMSDAFANYSNEKELKDEIHYFVMSINTTFAYQFMTNLLYAEKYGAKSIQENIKFLYQEMEKQYSTILEVQVEQKDAIQLGTWGGFFIILTIVLSFAATIGFHMYYRLQFYTKTGILFLAATVITTILSMFIAAIISKPKLDY